MTNGCRFSPERPLLGLVFLLLFTLASGAAGLDRLEIETDSGNHVFQVELALTGNQRAVGLMNRAHMDQDAGMLFRFDRPQRVQMWMKNTLIALDMIFIRADGTVANIHKNAVPHSLKIIQASEPVLYVLELNGGMADRIGLRPGHRVIHPMVGK